MSFTPPPYPYERLDVLRKLAATHEGGPIDCSIGTPIDPPPRRRARGVGEGSRRAGLPALAGHRRTFASRRPVGCSDDSASTIPSNDVAACIGTKEFVATLAGYLHLRSPERDTVLYPAISYPTYAMSATLAGLRSVPVALRDGRLDLASIDPDDVARALVLWANSPSNPTGFLDDLERGRDVGPPERRAGRE